MARDQAKILLVTADDLGLCPSVSDGIFDACQNGIVRAASLLAVGEDAARAAKLGAKEPGLHIGVHLALVDGRPLSPRGEVTSLIDADGAFPAGYPQFLRRYLGRKVRLDEVYREWRAQIEQTIAWGIRPAHLDSHQHLHLLPGLFEIAVRLCRELAIPRLRLPSGGFRALGHPAQAAMELLVWRGKRALKKAPPLSVCERFLGRKESCQLSLPSLLNLIERVRPGTQELMCHPGQENCDALRRHPFGKNWAQELKALTSVNVRARIRERGIVLVGAL